MYNIPSPASIGAWLLALGQHLFPDSWKHLIAPTAQPQAWCAQCVWCVLSPPPESTQPVMNSCMLEGGVRGLFCVGTFCKLVANICVLGNLSDYFACVECVHYLLLVGSPLCKCHLPLSFTTSALKTHYVQAPQDPQDMKLKLDSSYLYGNGSPQLFSDQLMTYSSIRV